jgi:hypothetical protein
MKRLLTINKKLSYAIFVCAVFLLIGLTFGFGQVDAQAIQNISPSVASSPIPTEIPTLIPTDLPAATPTEQPTEVPTILPTAIPTAPPTVIPTVACSQLPTNTGTVTTTVTIGTSGMYTVWSRILPPNSLPASYYLQVDNQCGIKVGGFNMNPSVWTWVNNTARDDGIIDKRILLNLTQGTHLVKLIGNTPNLGLDRIIFTNFLDCIPGGFGNNCNQISTQSVTVVPTNKPTSVPTSSVSGAPVTVAPVTTTGPIPTDTPAPTATPVPGTQFAIIVLLHGVGHGGDNVAPNSNGNDRPIHIQRTAALQIYDSNNTLVASPTGVVTFDPLTGTYKGIIDVGRVLPPGAYITKIIVAYHLNKSAVKIVTITAGEANPIALDAVSEVAGDLNGDGKLNIEDFNIMLNCVSDLGPAKQCTPDEKDAADVNDDGVVDLADLNLYFREIAVQTGQ